MSLPLDTPVSGAKIEAPALIAARFPARYINVTHATRALASLAGAKRSRRRGRGVEFDEVRQYAAGDDVRSIDWRVTARSGEAHTKLFHEERERPVLVAVDLRNRMRFGSRNCFKSVLAAHLASLVLWSALDKGERVGGLVLSGEEAPDVRPQRSRRAVLSMIGNMERCAAQASPIEMTFAEQLRELQRIARPGSSLFIISDFSDAAETGAMDVLRRLVRHTQITGLVVSDPLEQELPEAGRYVVCDDQGRSTLDTASADTRARFATDYRESRERLVESYQGLRIPLIHLSTGEPPLPVLQQYFPVR